MHLFASKNLLVFVTVGTLTDLSSMDSNTEKFKLILGHLICLDHVFFGLLLFGLVC